MTEFLWQTLLVFLMLCAVAGYWIVVVRLCAVVGEVAEIAGYRGDGAVHVFLFLAFLLFIAAIFVGLGMSLEAIGC